jgi:cobalt-zinc-cadmium efflux system membrane fusion protein
MPAVTQNLPLVIGVAPLPAARLRFSQTRSGALGISPKKLIHKRTKRIRTMRIILILFVYIACVSSQAEERFVAINAQQRLALGIQVAPPHSATEMQGAAVPGKVVVPNAQLVVVSASQPGLVERLFVAAGEQVKKGQALGRLRSPKLLALQREYLKTLAQLRVASRNLERDRRLAEKGIVTERQLLMSSGRWEVLKVQHSSLHEFLRLSGMSEAVIHELEVQGRYHSQLVIESPRDGVVLTQMMPHGTRHKHIG